ncbi:MAG TPA: hypothetical protein VD837_07950 [Terriglobales bacterium]|nr:hypothetical protein [Terriglobales bacterium]
MNALKGIVRQVEGKTFIAVEIAGRPDQAATRAMNCEDNGPSEAHLRPPVHHRS